MCLQQLPPCFTRTSESHVCLLVEDCRGWVVAPGVQEELRYSPRSLTCVLCVHCALNLSRVRHTRSRVPEESVQMCVPAVFTAVHNIKCKVLRI